MDRRAQLSGAQFHARHDEDRRRRAVLSLELPEPGIAGLAEVSSTPYPDPTQFDPKSPYYDPKSTQEAPRWLLVDVRFVKKSPLVPLAALREHDELADMRVLARGNRLSITPVTRAEWRFITEKLMK
ncbi:EVE domain protein [Burkholderia cenocepacia]|nr:EVE domain protein [Burkholderia cenocepacia]